MPTPAPARVAGLRPGALLMVMPKVGVTLAPAASVTVTLPLPKVPATEGVPVKLMVLPLTVAVSPGGRSLEALRVNGLVPPLIASVPGKVGRPAVHCVADRLPSVGAALTVMLLVVK